MEQGGVGSVRSAALPAVTIGLDISDSYAERKPLRDTTDLHPAYWRAIRWIIGRKAAHRTTQYLNNYTEQSHRAVKQRYYPMLGFGIFESASRFCAALEELRQYFSVRRRGQAARPAGRATTALPPALGLADRRAGRCVGEAPAEAPFVADRRWPGI